MGIKELTDYSIRTGRNEELVLFLIQLSNLSVLSEESLSARIYGLMTVLKGITEIEMMCLNRIEKMLVEQGFKAKRADEEDIRRILAVYFEQNVTTERFEEFDGERWIILND